jgi:SAM-dependent methyltransferase
METLVAPQTRKPVTLEGSTYVGPEGERYDVEDGVVRMLRAVDPELAREIEAQDIGVDEYANPDYLMPHYEREMARLAVIELFGGRPPSGRILDAGCGIGLLGRMYPELGLIGLDASMTLLRRATTGYRLRVEASAEELPFADGSFDVVVALNMLHHVINPERAVREFARVLVPGGTLVAVDPRKVWPIELAKRLLRGSNSAFAPTHKAFKPDEYAQIVRQSGLFEIEDSRRVGFITLIGAGGLDALHVSKFLKAPDTVLRAFTAADRLAFAVPGMSSAGLNLALRARRA